ncbi:formate dehydrogenase subunit delta [Vineibacter terrae]|uniref:formate dehydrogenase subunit delta n=1 Tax=Vineibacter terrae TaxID=2586908 RepID=UPI002E37AEC2|nr:formate dehydrogenase subunit delta [Vineibacter terrae]HEX2890113.1 formate dehydrogenase subunit delta [Vineibacter terrae]
MSPDKLVYMANQIGKFFAHQGEAKAAAGIADHIAKFWDPRMRAAIQAHVASGGAGLDPPVLQAVQSLKPSDRGRPRPHSPGA